MKEPANPIAFLLQEERQRFISERLGEEPWITVCEHVGRSSDSDSGSYFCALIPNNKVQKVLNNTSWDFSIGNGLPGFVCSSYPKKRNVYCRFGDDDGIEPLVFDRSFPGNRPGYVEILEEFRHFHNLFHDTRNNRYLKIDDNGDEEDVIRIVGDKVQIKLRSIRQFLAVKRMHLAVYFDFVRYAPESLEELKIEDRNARNIQSGLLTYQVDVANAERMFLRGKDEKSFSRLLGKKLIVPLPLKRCGVYPYEEPDVFEDFIIETNAEGSPVFFTCDPDKLSNYFGANPDAPNFLTPVFFRRDVLGKYFANPDKYSVSDGYLRCSGSWDLRIDNNHKDYVVVFLGDLGQGLSRKEQIYWKSYNVPPDGGISSTNSRRSFLAQWTDPERPDLLFKSKFKLFQEQWIENIGWPLFKELAEGDRHLFNALRVPLNNDQSEFDQQVLALTKILIDSLNEAALAKELPALEPNDKGIKKLEKYLEVKGLSDRAKHVQFLKDLQALRSAGVGHRKGEHYIKIAAAFRIGELEFRPVFEAILGKANELLGALVAHFLDARSPDSSSSKSLDAEAPPEGKRG